MACGGTSGSKICSEVLVIVARRLMWWGCSMTLRPTGPTAVSARVCRRSALPGGRRQDLAVSFRSYQTPASHSGSLGSSPRLTPLTEPAPPHSGSSLQVVLTTPIAGPGAPRPSWASRPFLRAPCHEISVHAKSTHELPSSFAVGLQSLLGAVPAESPERASGAMSVVGYLVDVSDPTNYHEVFAGRVSVGRAESNDIKIASRSVSSHHAEIELDPAARKPKDGIGQVADLGSRNATFVNEVRVLNSSAKIEWGAVLRFGYDNTTYRLVQELDEPKGATRACLLEQSLVVPCLAPRYAE